VATPTSAIPAALASADTSKKSAVVMTILRFNALEVINKQLKIIFFHFKN
jgi:hypothetical protein